MPVKTPRVSKAAQDDLDEIWLYIARDSERYADRVTEELYNSMFKLAGMPGMGRARREFAADESLFFWSSGNYVIVYYAQKDPIEIVRVLHTARDISALLEDLKT